MNNYARAAVEFLGTTVFCVIQAEYMPQLFPIKCFINLNLYMVQNIISYMPLTIPVMISFIL